MKNLLYLLLLTFLLPSCAALRPPKVTSDSPRFDRFYEASKRCLKMPEGRKKIGQGVYVWYRDVLAYLWSGVLPDGQEFTCICAMEAGYYHASQTYEGRMYSFIEEHEEKVAYSKFSQIFLTLGCPVIGEPELNRQIKQIKDQKPNIWNFKTGSP